MAFRAILIAVLSAYSLPYSAHAEDVYSWKDERGNTFFGSTPPHTAVSVSKLNSPSISRYSTKKVLSGYSSNKSQTELEITDIKADDFDMRTAQEIPDTTTEIVDTPQTTQASQSLDLPDDHQRQ